MDLHLTFPVKEISVVSTALYLLGGFICGMLVEPFSEVVADKALVVRLDAGVARIKWMSDPPVD